MALWHGQNSPIDSSRAGDLVATGSEDVTQLPRVVAFDVSNCVEIICLSTPPSASCDGGRNYPKKPLAVDGRGGLFPVQSTLSVLMGLLLLLRARGSRRFSSAA